MSTSARTGTGQRPVKSLFWKSHMHIIREPSSVHQISSNAVRELVRKRIDDLGGDAFNTTELGFFLVLECGDKLEAINAQLGFDILRNRMTGVRYDHTDYTPPFEFIESFPSCFDMVFILSDDGFGVEVFIPKEEGLDHDLLAMCQRYAVKGTP
jgi:hypothetical protein